MASKMLLDVIDKLMKKTKLKAAAESSDQSINLHDMRIDAVLANLTENMIRQTTILERMAQDHSELAKLVTKMDSKIDVLSDRHKMNN